jgi:3-deoxy-manno-octulosonate cytidylyltransferase (CMP-KDO synthetase)
MYTKALVLIPSRFKSTRFEGKPLAKINGKPMVQWVYEGCSKIHQHFPHSVVAVVTDDDNIEKCVKGFGGNVVRVDDDVPSGSERINLAYQRHFKDQEFDLIVNVQGDEPLIEFELLEKLVTFHRESEFDVATVVKEISVHDEGYQDSNKVKAIYNKQNGRCHYFTRCSFPYNRNDEEGVHWYLHVGIYSFRPEVLEKFCTYEPSHYETIESLEQLRLLDNGRSIGAVETTMHLCGVDTPEDIKYVEGILNGK